VNFGLRGIMLITVGKHGDESTIKAYVKSQGQERNYTELHKQQLQLFG